MAQTHFRLDPTRTGHQAQHFDNQLRKFIVGQDEAVEQVVNIYQRYLAGMNAPGRPIGNFLFLGPTGSGKTRVVEATAECLFSSPRATLKIDCAEFQHSHEIAKLIGSPPGYLGHRETRPLLCQEQLDQHHTDEVRISLVLFDEIEKASDALWNLLLGILDKATLTLGDNRKVDFTNSIIFMTSNLGAAEMSSLLNPKLGFKGAPETMDKKLDDKLARSGVEAARRKFTPEFMNRLDKVVTFRPLGDGELRRILDIELTHVQHRVFHAVSGKGFIFKLSEPAKDFLLREGTDTKYGARHLKRAIERLLVQPLSNLIVTDQIRGGDWIEVDFDSVLGSVTFTREAECIPAPAMAEILEGAPEAALAMAAGFGVPPPVTRHVMHGH